MNAKLNKLLDNIASTPPPPPPFVRNAAHEKIWCVNRINSMSFYTCYIQAQKASIYIVILNVCMLYTHSYNTYKSARIYDELLLSELSTHDEYLLFLVDEQPQCMMTMYFIRYIYTHDICIQLRDYRRTIRKYIYTAQIQWRIRALLWWVMVCTVIQLHSTSYAQFGFGLLSVYTHSRCIYMDNLLT